MNQLLINLMTGIVLPNLIYRTSHIDFDTKALYFVYTYKHVETGIACTIVLDEGNAQCADEVYESFKDVRAFDKIDNATK